jgi:hypothetical protein
MDGRIRTEGLTKADDALLIGMGSHPRNRADDVSIGLNSGRAEMLGRSADRTPNAPKGNFR